LRPTLDLAVSLRRHGYVVGPHLAARQVKDRAELADIVAELKDAGVGSLFVIGGDADEPAGDFPDALSLLRVLNETGHPFEWIGIGGYPEGHGKISDELIEAAMEAKAPYATQIITQLCYHGDTLLDWARLVKSRGIDVPIRVGIPGSMSRQKLVRVSASLGLGQSARFLLKQQSMLWRFFMPGGYSPNKLVNRLAPHIGTSELNLRGFHVFTFNDLESTEHGRQSWLTKLAA
jgi:methylenetetrahydrofolate reductase (NADPH)